jgi:hypothetical protein
MRTAEQTMANGVKIITPPNTLREKVGYGGIDSSVISLAEQLIVKSDVDFQPYAKNFLDQIEQTINTILPIKTRPRDMIDSLVKPIMNLKANGGMFKYPLATEIADIALDFLEGLDTLNDDALGIIIAHQKTLRVIINSKLTGNGGEAGQALANELYEACKRYHKKHSPVKED